MREELQSYRECDHCLLRRWTSTEIDRGGDYGFAWTPHGTYARDLEHFVKLLDFTPMESIIAATAGVAKLFMQENELGKIAPGYYADCILVNGDPLEDISVLQEHGKLDVIMINGRLHKASFKEFSKAATQTEVLAPVIAPMTNFVAFETEEGQKRIGHLSLDDRKITPLTMKSGAPLDNLYQVIELQNEVVPAGDATPLDTVKLLAPISGRDILCVGKNYSAHAKEFNNSGYDSSDKNEQPSRPVIFTKRATSIIGSGDSILPHLDFTQTLDYEGEIGVIIGKSGFAIDERNAMDHVWGYTIINDVTARERQRDHKQFYIGKSADTFCPMGPIAVPAAQLPQVLTVETRVNGRQRQLGTTDDLIFSVARLVKDLSAGITIQPGDVIATGTPAGVGFGQKPPCFLKPGDRVEISVTGLGTLRNTVAETSIPNKTTETVQSSLSSIPIHNLDITCGGAGLTRINSKLINIATLGSGPDPIIYIHGMGGTMEFYRPLLQAAGLLSPSSPYKHILYDLEGHGQTPTSACSEVTISSLVADLHGLIHHPDLALHKSAGGVTLVAHSLGSLIALNFALAHPTLIKKHILLGPAPSPLPAPAAKAMQARAAAVRSKGMLGSGVADAVSQAATSSTTQTSRPLSMSLVRASLLSQDPEGYAKCCTALADTAGTRLEIEKLPNGVKTLVVAGADDKVSSPDWARKIGERMGKGCKVRVLKGVEHWHCFEDLEGVSKAVREFL